VSEILQSTTNPTRRKEFARVIAPLERAARQRLVGKHRDDCFDGFLAYPDGFREQACQALAEGRNPLRLLIWRINQRAHEIEPCPGADLIVGEGNHELIVCGPFGQRLEKFATPRLCERRAAALGEIYAGSETGIYLVTE
jgi:hypothetical protein